MSSRSRKLIFILLLSAITLIVGMGLLPKPGVAQEMPRKETIIVRAGAKVPAPELYNPFLPGYTGWTGNDWAAERLMYMNL
ncbi:MAG: hypothetical protein ACUVXI_15170 [bacterium]